MRNASRIFAAALLQAVVTAQIVAAEDAAQKNGNVLIRTGAEIGDRISLTQSAGGEHFAQLHIAQENALLVGSTWSRATPSLLTPGKIDQTGEGQSLLVRISGQDNQFAVSQAGARNTAFVLTVGQANMVSVAQAGLGNRAGVTQSGMRNSVAIIQN